MNQKCSFVRSFSLLRKRLVSEVLESNLLTADSVSHLQLLQAPLLNTASFQPKRRFSNGVRFSMGLGAHHGFSSGHRVLITASPQGQSTAPGAGHTPSSWLWGRESLVAVNLQYSQELTQLLWHRTTLPEFTAEGPLTQTVISRFRWSMILLSPAVTRPGSERTRSRIQVELPPQGGWVLH